MRSSTQNGEKRRDHERGASLVEFALLLPLFMMLLLGMLSGGQAYNRKVDITNAVREGARYGATLSKTTSGWADKVRNVVIERSGEDLATTDVCVALLSGTTASPTIISSTTGSQCPDAGDTGQDPNLRVQVSATKPSKIEALVFSYTMTLETGAVARHEGN